MSTRHNAARPRVTVDTSVLLEYVKRQDRSEIAAEIIALHRAGVAEVAVTRYVDADVPHDPHASEIRQLPILRAAGVFTIGESALGGGDGLGWQFFVDVERLFCDWRPTRGKPPDRRDWRHLHAHMIQRRDVFLTWDGPLLELADVLAPLIEQPALQEGLVPLSVVRPETFLESLNQQ